MSKPTVRDMLLLHGTLLLYSVAGMFNKLAGARLAGEDWSPALLFMLLAVGALLLYSVLWQQVLKRMPLNFAYSNKGATLLWTTFFCVAFLGEAMTWGKAVGLLVVLIGVTLVVTDHE